MNKELLKSILTLIQMLIWLSLLVKISYEWFLGKEPDNFTVLLTLLMTISLESRFNRGKQ